MPDKAPALFKVRIQLRSASVHLACRSAVMRRDNLKSCVQVLASEHAQQASDPSAITSAAEFLRSLPLGKQYAILCMAFLAILQASTVLNMIVCVALHGSAGLVASTPMGALVLLLAGTLLEFAGVLYVVLPSGAHSSSTLPDEHSSFRCVRHSGTGWTLRQPRCTCYCPSRRMAHPLASTTTSMSWSSSAAGQRHGQRASAQQLPRFGAP